MTRKNPAIDWGKFLKLSKDFFSSEIEALISDPEYRIGEDWFNSVYKQVYPRSSPAINLFYGRTNYSPQECTSFFYVVRAAGKFEVTVQRKKGEMVDGFPCFTDSEWVIDGPREEDIEVFKYGMTVKQDILSRDKVHYKEVITQMPIPKDMQAYMEEWFCLVLARDYPRDHEFLDGVIDSSPLEKVMRKVKSIDSKKQFARKEAFFFRTDASLLVDIANTALRDLRIFAEDSEANSAELGYAANIAQIISNALYWSAMVRSDAFRKARGQGREERISKLLQSSQLARDCFREGVITNLGYPGRKNVDAYEPKVWDFAVRYGFDEILSEKFWSDSICRIGQS